MTYEETEPMSEPTTETEPERYEAVIEFCFVGGLTGWISDDRCPDCNGHAVKQETDEWKAWDKEQRICKERESRLAEEARRRKRKPKPPPSPEQQCSATAQTTGKRCKQYRWAVDPNRLCASHAAVLARYSPEELQQRADAMSDSADSLTDR